MWVFFLQDKPNINALSSNIKCTVLTTTSLVSYNMYKTLQHVLSPEKGNMTHASSYLATLAARSLPLPIQTSYICVHSMARFLAIFKN